MKHGHTGYGRRHVLAAPVATALVVLLIVGCSTQESQSPQTNRPEPPSTDSATTSQARELTRSQEFQAITDYAGNMVDCMNADGYRYRLVPGGMGWEYDPAYPEPDDSQAAEVTRQECDSRYGPPPAPQPLTAEEWASAYPAAVEQSRCLADNGFDAPQLPTQETWVQQMLAPTTDTYDAFGQLEGEQLLEAQRKCAAPDVLQILAEAESSG